MKLLFAASLWALGAVPLPADVTVTITKGPDNQIHIETDQQAASIQTNPAPVPSAPPPTTAPDLAPPADAGTPDAGSARHDLEQARSQNNRLKEQVADLQRRLDQYHALLAQPVEIEVKDHVISLRWSGAGKDLPLPPDGKVTLQLAPQ